MYSSIIKKTCKCGCSRMPSIGYEGYNMDCRPDLKEQKIKEQQQRQKQRNVIKKTTSKLRNIAYTSDELREAGKKYNALDNWFKERRKEMQNVCIECGNRTNRDSDKYYKWSICHIAPKALVKSVATDINNWVELCWLHHQEFDSTFDRSAAMQCFPEVKQKFQLFKHLIPSKELRKINPHLLT